MQGLGHELVIRAMPNTPARIAMGITVWTSYEKVSENQKQQAQELFRHWGRSFCR
jgi:pyrroline-5-carboxylate reductase